MEKKLFQPLGGNVMPRFGGPGTMMRLPSREDASGLDACFIGVPFDIGVNYRSGARQGPAAVREASRLIRRIHPTSEIAPYDICNVADVGDAPVNPIDFNRSIEMIEGFYRHIHEAGAVPISVPSTVGLQRPETLAVPNGVRTGGGTTGGGTSPRTSPLPAARRWSASSKANSP